VKDMTVGRITFASHTGVVPVTGNLGSPPDLIAMLEKAKLHKITPKEAYEQKVSFVYGQLMDCNPSITKEEIKRHLAEMGCVDPSPHEDSEGVK